MREGGRERERERWREGMGGSEGWIGERERVREIERGAGGPGRNKCKRSKHTQLPISTNFEMPHTFW